MLPVMPAGAAGSVAVPTEQGLPLRVVQPDPHEGKHGSAYQIQVAEESRPVVFAVRQVDTWNARSSEFKSQKSHGSS